MTDAFRKAYLGALALMDTMGPRGLHSAAAFACEDPLVKCDDVALRTHLASSHPDDALTKGLHLRLATWDSAETEEAWAAGTAANTEDRRREIVRRLMVDNETAVLFRERFPVAGVEEPIIIADQWDPWYTESIRQERGFYWNHYSQFLSRNWSPIAVSDLNAATDRVVERLSDPTREDAYQAKGLVVGYVQSGKTANFTGVLAKAIDVGYRLIIVLTGTTDLLRAQTQRRLDMELVGRENILRGINPHDHEALDSIDYQDDPDWLNDKFVRHGTRPSDTGFPDIHRLTNHRFDYKSLQQGIAALDFEKRERNRPFFSPENLFFSDARLLVVKKNATVLGKLVKDLNKITARLGEIPTLIVDDESDQASVNTSNPKRWKADQVERTAINRLISQLLVMLPRAQYVGYTATPFANVFIDPCDAENIFPKDFLISLGRTPEYMGAPDFHDLDSDLDREQRTFSNSNEKAHVRILKADGAEGDEREILDALDAYVLTGAVKVYRERQGIALFKHHTMLIHEAMQRDVHREQAERVYELWKSAGYFSSSSHERLRLLYERDMLPVTQAVGEGLPAPATFEELLPSLGEAISRIGQVGNPVIVVNSDKDIEQEDLDFDRNNVWRILVGGNKLARGFTVEGLTISYYRRLTKQADTLMQMGRWLGYRKGFRDLVRLYITPELHEAFEAIVLDEDYFRAELRRYAHMIDGRPQVTPKEIPPLVAQHLPWLKPTTANKMYNAVLTERRSPGVPIEPRGYPSNPKQIRQNTLACKPLFKSIHQLTRFRTSDKVAFNGFVGLVDHSEFIEVFSALAWEDRDSVAPDVRWLSGLSGSQIKDWALLFPQHVRSGEAQGTIHGKQSLSLFRRSRLRPSYFGAISESRHRPVANRIAGATASFGDVGTEALTAPRRGAVIIYPVIDKNQVVGPPSEVDPGRVVVAFHIVAPRSAISPDRRMVTFTTRDRTRSNSAIIDVREVRG
ncbi:Z1 domain-containing protein [Nonomuraea glycinis]|uniref:Putative endonuclease Z1 domain-containing protein n=1 Tax=Nonomuraea glycinis TaxID=2047744 RepID=A0A918E8H8_9ACTN|nr:Z1 domain-containing protein [Nonomuraea glycinis]MCA2180807.1 Z1 domain-containing protein [Nonomuraea glycinis]GGP12799.1 hypothetical protein GCM10012278_61970 [Nonomuraea glycinis]